jgi:phosphatidylinositol 3,5-bisphosphate 5-phosphatase
MDYSALASQALSAPPYLVSFGLVLLIAFLSDRHRSRSSYIILSSLVGAAGYAFLAFSGAFRFPSWLRYLAVYPAAAGFFCAITLIITWTINNQASNEGKGTGVAMLNVIGQFGPILGTRLYPDSDKPYYVTGMAVCAGFMLLVAGLAAGLRIVLRRTNARGEMEVTYAPVSEEADGIPLEEINGDEAPRKPHFVYML